MEFSPGLNILSGMSGAGKSVLLRALELVLGGRFSQKLMADGADVCEISALFQMDPAAPCPVELPTRNDEGGIVLRRIFKKDGKTLNYVNDRLASAELLKQLGQHLVRTLSQDEALGLRDTAYQLQLLDAYAYADMEAEPAAYQQQYGKLAAVRSSLATLVEQEKTWQRERQFVEFQLQELTRLRLKRGELAALEADHRTLAYSEEIRRSGGEVMNAAAPFLRAAASHLPRLRDFVSADHALAALAAEGLEIQQHMQEWQRTLQHELAAVESNPARLAQCDERMRVLRSACKKYGMEHDALCAHFEGLQAQAGDGGEPAARMEALRKEELDLRANCLRQAEALHKTRVKKARELSMQICANMAALEMASGCFNIELARHDEPGPQGISGIQFMLRATPDSPFRPLHETASGGERSRALLSICSACARALGTAVFVFDEIDTNIGSRLGRPVADAFLHLAAQSQLICVTHLAPVAACGQRHFLVEKDAHGSRVGILDEQRRLLEVAQMIAGEKNSPSALEQARHMLTSHSKPTPALTE